MDSWSLYFRVGPNYHRCLANHIGLVPSTMALVAPCLAIILGPLVGYFWGRLMWWWCEKQYFQHFDHQCDDSNRTDI